MSLLRTAALATAAGCLMFTLLAAWVQNRRRRTEAQQRLLTERVRAELVVECSASSYNLATLHLPSNHVDLPMGTPAQLDAHELCAAHTLPYRVHLRRLDTGERVPHSYDLKWQHMVEDTGPRVVCSAVVDSDDGATTLALTNYAAWEASVDESFALVRLVAPYPVQVCRVVYSKSESSSSSSSSPSE